MRRIRRALFAGFGLTLGVLAGPATAQTGNPGPQPARAAKLGRPVAIPESPATGVTPAGLVSRSPEAPGPGPAPAPTPTAIPMPMPGPTLGGGGAPPPARPVTLGPSVTEVRTPSATLAPGPVGIPGYPPVVSDPGFGVIQGVPTLVPSVGPEGMIVPMPGFEVPVPGACPVEGCPLPGFGALGRVQGCNRWWVSAESLLWWTRNAQIPPLVTTSSPQFNGIMGQGDTVPLLTGSFGQGVQAGGRFTVGRWFGTEQVRGLEGRMFFLGRSDALFTASTDQFPLLARPFNNVNTPVGPFSEVIGAPGLAVGGVQVSLQNSVWGAEANYRRFLFGNPCARVDGIVGYRYFGMTEQLVIGETFARTPGSNMAVGAPVMAGTVTDSFRTENDFHGGQIGLAAEVRRGRWSLDARTTVAFGNLFQTLEINGGQTLTMVNGTTQTTAGGLLALQGANIGKFTNSRFAVIPEVGFNVGYDVTSNLRLFVGYNFVYLGNALRPGDAIDTSVDVARIPNFPVAGNPAPLAGVPRPTPQFRASDFFVQGISFGMQWKW